MATNRPVFDFVVDQSPTPAIASRHWVWLQSGKISFKHFLFYSCSVLFNTADL